MAHPTEYPILHSLALNLKRILVAGYRRTATPTAVEVLKNEQWMVLSACGQADCMKMAERCLPDLFVVDGTGSISFALDLLYFVRSNEVIGQAGAIVLGDGRNKANEIRVRNAGADDFFTTDFIELRSHRKEFLTRVKGVMDRSRTVNNRVKLHYADVEMDLAHHRVIRNGVRIDLGAVQFRLLWHFLENPKRVFSEEELGAVVRWGGRDRTARTVETYVDILRGRLNQGNRPDLIRVVKGGYWLSNVGAKEEWKDENPVAPNEMQQEKIVP